MQAVNLLPAYARPAGRWSAVGKGVTPVAVTRIGGVVAAACALAIAGVYVYERSIVSNRHATLTTVQARLTAVEAIAAPLRAAQSASQARAAAVRSIDHSRVRWEGILSDLARVMPNQVYLKTLNAEAAGAVAPATPTAAPTPGVTAASTSFTITGVAASQADVALVLDRLALLPWLSDVTLQTLARAVDTTGSVGDNFSISAGFSPPLPGIGAQ